MEPQRIKRTAKASPSCVGEAFAVCLDFQTPQIPKRLYSHAISGWDDDETGRRDRAMVAAVHGNGRCRSCHRPVPVARPADKACGAPFFPLQASCLRKTLGGG